jgi:hypothetical protein
LGVKAIFNDQFYQYTILINMHKNMSEKPKKYLYAAAVQGIQDFIFETNKLQEIAGASELVEQICTKEFKKAFDNAKGNYNEQKLLIGAAGNIKYLFDENEEKVCEQIFRDFPFQVAKLAPGITISQTVVKISEDEHINSRHIDKAEKNLKIQRNLPTSPSLMGLMIAKRTPKTGKPVVDNVEGEFIDAASQAKISRFNPSTISLFKNIVHDNLKDILSFNKGQKMTNDDNSWLAVIHADGNDLGKLIPTFFNDTIKGDDFVRLQKQLSFLLDSCTKEAVKSAIEKVLGDKKLRNTLDLFKNKLIVPIRPIVCGGDDLTIIIQAPLALEFTKVFLEEFTRVTKDKFVCWAKEVGTDKLKHGLTACAGIAFVKEKYPFHYAVDLAGELCSHAKKEAQKIKIANNQDITPACLSFYKIESAFVRDYTEIQKHELTSKTVVNLSACPYYIKESPNLVSSLEDKVPMVSSLENRLSAVKKYPAITSRLRQVLSMLHTENDLEPIKMERKRIEQLNPIGFKEIGITEHNLSQLHDLLSLNSITNK